MILTRLANTSMMAEINYLLQTKMQKKKRGMQSGI